MLKVTLLAHTPQPERTVAAAAKLCYSPASIDDVLDGLTEEKTASFVNMLAEIGMKARSSTPPLPLESRACPVLCWHRLPGTASLPSAYRASGM